MTSSGKDDEFDDAIRDLITKRLEILAQLHEAEGNVSGIKASLTRINSKLVEKGVALTGPNVPASWW